MSPLDVKAAVDALVKGYQEEANLYQVVHDLTLTQREILERRDLQRFNDLLEEKEDLLQLIGQIDSQMAPARSLVMHRNGAPVPNGQKLAELLDRLATLIEEIRLLESQNAALLDAVAKAG